jgi:hypothetical protein
MPDYKGGVSRRASEEEALPFSDVSDAPQPLQILKSELQLLKVFHVEQK